MEIVTLRYKIMNQALSTLNEGLEELEALKANQSKAHRLMRDGVIQRFEYCIDTFWKFLKVYLERVQKVHIEQPSPRIILRISLKMALISDKECDALVDCVADRNLTSHTYNEEIAEKIQGHVFRYYITMKSIMDRFSNQILIELVDQ